MINIDDLFDSEADFAHSDILKDITYPWESLKRIPNYIQTWIRNMDNSLPTVESVPWGDIQEAPPNPGNENIPAERLLYIQNVTRLKEDILLKNYNIHIGVGTLLEPSAIIKPNVIIGRNCEVRQGAYIRGNVISGDNVVIGHNTEVKNAIIMNHSEAGHFSYIGDSIIGSYVNLGAGTKLANLQFRTIEEKKTGNLQTIKLINSNSVIDTETAKLGAILGDGCELGCNSVTSPCTILGKSTRVLPVTTIKKGVYPAMSFIKC